MNKHFAQRGYFTFVLLPGGAAHETGGFRELHELGAVSFQDLRARDEDDGHEF